jgi:hypothetical protein
MTLPPADGPTRRLRQLCIFVVVAACAEFVIATTGMQIQRLPPSTDFASYYLAGAQANDGLSPYDRAGIAARGHTLGFPHEQFPFLYPPPFALLMRPLARLPYPRARQLWMLLGTLEILAALGITAALAFRQARALGLEDSRRTWIVLTAFVPAALNSTSVHNDIRAGSVGCLLWLAMALVAWAVLDVALAKRTSSPSSAPGRQLLGGVSLAIAALAKLVPAAFVPWALWRGARRLAWIATLLLALSMLPALWHWGWSIVPDYLQHAILPSLRDEVAPPMNQSLDAFLSRLFVPSSIVAAPFDAPVLKRLLSALCALVIAAMTMRAVVRRVRSPGLLPVEAGAVLLALLMLMKLTWVHTLASMLWVWPALMVAILRAAELDQPWARRAGLLACLGFFLSSAHVPILWERLRHGPAVLVTGVHLIGLLLLWGSALWVLERGDVASPLARSTRAS